MNTFKFTIKGLVQGVYYRKTTAENAIKAGFVGYVKNLPNGDVEAGANLDDSNFDLFINILNQGSRSSRVDKIVYQKLDGLYQFDKFEIRY